MKLSRAGRVGRTGDVIDSAVDEWNSALADFQQRERDLRDAETRLYDIYPIASQNEEDLAEWQSLMDKTIAINSTLESIHSAMGTVSGWWSSFTGMIPGLSGYRRLGAAQFLLPVSVGALVSASAAIVALVASVSAFITYINTKNNYLSGLEDDVETMREAGATEAQINDYVDSRVGQAKEIAKQQSGYNPTADLVKVAALALAGVALVIVVPRIIAPKR